jgi:hypothetical protein
MAEPAFSGDPLERLRARIQAAEAAASRLAAEARAARGGGPGRGGDSGSGAAGGGGAPGDPGGSGNGHDAPPPPRGWEVPGRTNAGDDLAALSLIVEGLKGLIPPELQQRLADAVRDVLIAIRALIDWYLERSERGRGQDLEVEDIPID